MLHFTIALMFLLTSKPGPQIAAAPNWVTIGKVGNDATLQADTTTYQKSVDKRALSLRVVHAVPNERGVKFSSFFVWLDCSNRSFRLIASRDDDAQGKNLARRSYETAGRGFERAKPGTAVATALTIVCD